MKIEIGDKVRVKKGAGDFYEECLWGDADYLVITGIPTKESTQFSWDAFKNGKNPDYCYGHELTESDFIPYEKTLYTLSEGDVVVDRDGDEQTVLQVTGKVIFLGGIENKEYMDSVCTAKQLKDFGYKVKQETPQDDMVELTLEEVAALKGIPVEKLRIKDK